jgi:tight adherence protein B
MLRRFAARWFGPREAHDAAELAAVLDTVSRRCASGESLGVALTAALRTANRLAEPASVLDRGGTVLDALAAVRPTDPDVTLAVHVLALCAAQGGNVSESLDRAAATLRERNGARLERRAHSAQARLSARVLTVVPIAFAGWTLATTPTVRAFSTTPAGLACVALGAAANAAGWRLMNRAIRSSE